MFGVDENKMLSYSADEPPGSVAVFESRADLTAVAERIGWSKSEVTDIWNANAGRPPFDDLEPVKRFRNRPYGLDRIWEVVQRLKGPLNTDPDASEPEPEAVVAPVPATNGSLGRSASQARPVRRTSGTKRCA